MRLCHLLIPAIVALTLTFPPPANTGDYLVTVSETGGDLSLQIEANVPTTDRLKMARYGGIDHMPDQWTSFVQNLSVVDRSGVSVAYRHDGPDGWILDPVAGPTLTLHYSVDLSFAENPWPPGNEQAGQLFDQAIYLVTRPLFIYTESDARHTVRFSLPADWVATTPWEWLEPMTFGVPGNESLVENTVVLGRHTPHVFREGPFSLIVVPLGHLGDGAARVPQVLGATVQQAMQVFSGAKPGRIMMTFFPAHQDDGESFYNSAAFTVGKAMNESGVPLWGNNLAHELFHHWIGGDIALSDDDSGEWFEEGFTDYFADRSLVRSGHFDVRGFLTKAEKVIGRYLYFYSGASFEPLPMIEASKNKGRNRFAVYDGGWALALCLDIRLRAYSAAGIDDLMRRLHAAGTDQESALAHEDFLDAVTATSSLEVGQFVQAALTSHTAFPIRGCLAHAGLDLEIQAYAAEAWISRAPPSTTFDEIVSPSTR